MSSPLVAAEETIQLRRADNSERFVGFAFAGADMVAETDVDGVVTYAAGAFRSRFGRPPEAFIGRDVRELVAKRDHADLDCALAFLVERGRLPPLAIRLSDAERTCVALAGLARPGQAGARRLCLTFARPPSPAPAVLRAGTGHGLAREIEARLRTGGDGDLSLLEIVGEGSHDALFNAAVGRILETAAPEAVASEIAPGRFGLLGIADGGGDLLSVTTLLETALRGQGMEVSVAAHHLPLDATGLTPTQAARALRQALNVFARDGSEGLVKSGLAGGLAGYMRNAGAQAASLRRAIRGRHFTLAFQPIVSLTDRTTHHYEALLRPKPIADCDFAGPQEFVMLVEALGLADELDLAVSHAACEAAERAGAPVAFNLSGQSVQSAAFRSKLKQLLEVSKARRRGFIIVEMTETAEIEDVAEAILTADALRALEVPFCLDDFGAGASDVRLLRALAPDIVKLDGSYLPGITGRGRERALLAGMVEIARGAGAEVVAERVETEAEAEALRLLGVEYGQGWLFGAAGPHPGTAASTTAASVRPRGRKPGKESWS